MNNLNLKNNEIGIYVIMVVIILIICFLPSNNFITDITKNTGSLIIAFVCVCLFMLLDNRLAVLFLVLLVVSYYKNMKNNLAEKFSSEDPYDMLQAQMANLDTQIAEKETQITAEENEKTNANKELEKQKKIVSQIENEIKNEELTEDELSIKYEELQHAKSAVEAEEKKHKEASEKVDKLTSELLELKKKPIEDIKAQKEQELLAKETEEKILELGVSNPGFAKIEQVKNQQLRDIKKKTNQASSDLESAIAHVNQEFNKNIKESQTLCDKIKDVNKAMGVVGGGVLEPFLQGRIPEVLRENFIKGGVPFNNQERARNFKDSDLVKNLNGLATQNDKSGYDVTGCRMVTSDDDSITKTYNTLNGPPLASFDYDTLQKEFVGTPFYPLNN